MVHSYYKYPFIQVSYICSMHSIVTTFRGAVIKVKVANFCAAMDTLIDQDAPVHPPFCVLAQFYTDEILHSTFKLAINCA